MNMRKTSIGRFFWSELKKKKKGNGRLINLLYALPSFRSKTFIARQVITFEIARHDCVNNKSHSLGLNYA